MNIAARCSEWSRLAVASNVQHTGWSTMYVANGMRRFLEYAADPDQEQKALSAWRRIKGYLTAPQQQRILLAWSKCLESRNPLFIEYACQRTLSELRYKARERRAGEMTPFVRS